MSIKLASINCHSLRCEIKQASVFNFLNANNINIVCLQETWMDGMHYKKILQNKWNCDAFMSPSLENNSCGVAILAKKNLNLNILKIFNDAEGRLVFIDFKIQDNVFRLINIYAPTNSPQRKEFFKFISVFTNCNKSLIMAGDFNMIESDLDKRGGNLENGYGGKQILNSIKETAEMKDAFRHLHPRKWEYSYHSAFYNVFVRIDRIYVSKTMLKSVESFDYMAVSGPDHLAAICNLKDISLHTNSIGRGLWRIDETILVDQSFKEGLHDLWNNNLIVRDNVYTLDWWETCKTSFKELAIKCKKEKMRCHHTEMKDLYHSLEMVRSFLRNEGCNQESFLFWNSQFKHLKELIMEKIKIQVTGLNNKKTLRDLNNNEKLTASFLDNYKISNKQYVKTLLDTETNEEFADNTNLMRIAKLFYKILYDYEEISLEAVENIISNLPCLTFLESNTLDGLITTLIFSSTQSCLNIFNFEYSKLLMSCLVFRCKLKNLTCYSVEINQLVKIN